MTTWLDEIEAAIEATDMDSNEAHDVYARVLRHRANLMSQGGKKCVACTTVRAIRHFELNIYGEDGLGRECKFCQEKTRVR